MVVTTPVLGDEAEERAVDRPRLGSGRHHDEALTVSRWDLAAVRRTGGSLGVVHPLPTVAHPCGKPRFINVHDLMPVFSMLLQFAQSLNAAADDVQRLLSDIHLSLR